MRANILLSILFVIATTFSSIHELKHIQNQDGAGGAVCIVGKNLSSADIINVLSVVDDISFDKIVHNTFLVHISKQKSTNQTRAPPFLS